MVYSTPDGRWAEKKVDGDRAGSVSDRQSDAIHIAKDKVRRDGGGEVTIQGVDGKIRAKDTVAPGNDPYPPKG
ncbi:DUF2188 domain-containing protein [Planctopirus hydrillae]|uniref:DUF2188 domain-containing protein n=1 Tax=Planctopirus hydrillae TaxID=1841610 RepID=UPI0009F73EE1